VSTAPPNIILITLDTVRAEELSIYGYDEDTCPNLSEFSNEATLFENGFSNAIWTVPAHASLFTGRLPSDHGCHGGDPHFEPKRETLPEIAAEKGYQTVGFSNNIWISDYFGYGEIFQELRKQWQLIHRQHDIAHLLKEQGEVNVFNLIPKLVHGNPLVDGLNALYGKFLYRRSDSGAKKTTDNILAFADDVNSPFFLFANFMEPHAPYYEHDQTGRFLPGEVEIDPAEYTEISLRSKDYHIGELSLDTADFEILRALYDGEIRYLDEQLGRLFDGLRRRGIFDESMIIVVGDHGENIGENRLMAHRFDMSDTLIRVPFIIKFPPAWDTPETFTEAVDFVYLYELLQDAIAGHQTKLLENLDLPVVAEYVNTAYTPEARDGQWSFEGSRYDNRYRCALTKQQKLVVDSSGAETLYHLNDRGTFEKDGTRVDEAESLPDNLYGAVSAFEDSFKDSLIIEDEEVRNHLENLGYL